MHHALLGIAQQQQNRWKNEKKNNGIEMNACTNSKKKMMFKWNNKKKEYTEHDLWPLEYISAQKKKFKYTKKSSE